MTTSGTDPREPSGTEPLDGSVSPPAGSDDDADGVAGPVFPPAETEPDAHDVGRRTGLGRLLHRDD